MTEDRISALLAKRDGTHGNYDDTAKAAQEVKDCLRRQAGWNDLTLVQREAIDLIATKLGRILAGNPNFPDHWDDIAGYARLASDRVSK